MTSAVILARSYDRRPMSAFLAMLARDLRVMRRSFATSFMRVILQPLLFVFVFAYVIPTISGGQFTEAAGTSYSTILVPGLVGMAIVTQGLFAVIFPLMMELSLFRSIEDRVLAPLPVSALAMEKIVAGAVQALIGGLLVFPAVLFIHAAGQAPVLHVSSWPLLILVMVTGSILASAGALFLGTVTDPDKIQVLFALVLLPMTMLGGVYYPWAALRSIPWLQGLVLANPMVYVSEGLRATLTAQLPHMPTPAFLLVLLVGAAGLCLVAVKTFTHRVIS